MLPMMTVDLPMSPAVINVSTDTIWHLAVSTPDGDRMAALDIYAYMAYWLPPEQLLKEYGATTTPAIAFEYGTTDYFRSLPENTKITFDAQDKKLHDFCVQVLAKLAYDKNPEIRHYAIAQFFNSTDGRISQHYMNFLNSPDKEVRLMAVSDVFMGMAHEIPGIRKKLEILLQDPVPEIRACAAKGLAREGDEHSLALLVKQASKENADNKSVFYECISQIANALSKQYGGGN